MTSPRRLGREVKLHKRNAPKARILVVDDDERNLLAISEVLKDLAEVVPATSGQEALRHLLKGEFAVILLDVFMPTMDGYEATRAIREWERATPDRRRHYIVALTANSLSGDREKCLDAGMDDYVSKPVRREDLLGALERGEAAVRG